MTVKVIEKRNMGRRIVETPLGPRVGSPFTPHIDAAYAKVKKAKKEAFDLSKKYL
ncbi:hypothetical protein [Enterococcus sp. AZ192]|uniref:hypothetical protein n=1 Tax=unclassified Enterococcus TaxID=2608891 RepID=UPI003D2903C9